MASARLNIVRRRESVAELERLGADAVMTMSPPPLRATSTRASRRRSATAVPSSSIRQRSIQTCVLSRSLGRAGLTPASTAPPSARSPPCSLRSGPACARCRWSRFAITSSAAAPCISITASRSTPGTTARRPAGSVRKEVAVQWNVSHVRLLDPRTGQLLREHRRHARRGQHAIHPDDRPARTPPSTDRPDRCRRFPGALVSGAYGRGFVTDALEGDKTASAVSDLLDLRRHMLSALIQLLSSGVTDENRIFTCPGVPATDSTALP
jgi:hypothetical protein